MINQNQNQNVAAVRYHRYSEKTKVNSLDDIKRPSD